MERAWRYVRETAWSGGPFCAGVDFVEADTAGDHGGAADRRLRRLEAAARRGAADRRSDDRRDGATAGGFGARSGRARYQADGETALGDPGGGVHLFHFESGAVAGDCPLLRRARRRKEHRAAQPETVRELRPDPAGSLAASGQTAVD